MTAQITDDYTGLPLIKMAPPRPEESADAQRVRGTLWERVAEQPVIHSAYDLHE